MKRFFIMLIVVLLPALSLADGTLSLDRVALDLQDKAAMQDGLRTFVNYCMGCHGARYQRYERVAADLGIPEAILLKSVVFTGARVGDHMESSMQSADAKAWFGSGAPDLTLVARVRGSDWLYTYLRGFYEDSTRPYGVNNTVFPNVGMPHVLAPLQGRQVLTCAPAGNDGACERLAVIPGTGRLSQSDYDEMVRNLVTFLAYSADPSRLESRRIGTYVLLFLLVFFVFAYLLKREYWRDIR
ncbi:cytochrome c1 [Azomonas macrocytogenes]|uniref:Ubiquinol-cytochrome c reductase cytochrome c1 subunit n=1 Tax=Azomonas macrocytogenes TaxID=69962 RepID=A0A839T860_AZOMA|nr:cytochrome c1 [Azomonas macrocytogenes]MBB3104656.1 ubiquinol-cytochrome c reductase cytochrome c1 subunit [Azomonas macrocytogenes]